MDVEEPKRMAMKMHVAAPTDRFPGYHDVRTIGHGSQGKVKSAIRNRDNIKVALKFLDPTEMTVSEITRMRQEHAHMVECSRHRHVIQLYGVQWNYRYRSKNGAMKSRVVFEMAYAEGGELFNVLSITGRLPEPIARTYFKQLMAGLEHCHMKGISHRDLKPENLLLDRFYNLQIADFGLSAKFQKSGGGAIFNTSIVGTPLYLPPEVVTGHYFGPLADIWSAGVVLFIMLTGVPPFQRPVRGDWWFNRLVNGEYEAFWKAHRRNARLSSEVENLIQKILHVDFRKRATITAIKRHAWMRGRTCSSEQLRSEFGRRQREVHKQQFERRMQQHAAAAGSADSASSAPATTSQTDHTMAMDLQVRALSFDRVFDPQVGPIGVARTMAQEKGVDVGKDKSATAKSDTHDAPALPPPVAAAATAASSSAAKNDRSKTDTSTSREQQMLEKVLETRSHFTCLITRQPAKQATIIERVQQACSHIRAKSKISGNPEPGTCVLKCEVETPTGLVKFGVTIIGVSDSATKKVNIDIEQHYVVEIRRLMGNSLQFRAIFEVICKDPTMVDLLASRYTLVSADNTVKTP